MGAREEKIVYDFITQFGPSWPPNLDETVQALAEDGYYQIVCPTIPPIRGRAAILKELKWMRDRIGEQRHDFIGMGSGGDTVYVERVDWSCREGKWSSIPLVAVFEVNAEGKISAWREFLDLANTARSHGITVETLLASLNLPAEH
jgi:limonene-1,2-epoxide hydrolase